MEGGECLWRQTTRALGPHHDAWLNIHPPPPPQTHSVSSHRPPLPPLPPVSMGGFKGGASLTEHLRFCSVGLVCLGGDGLPACPPPRPPPVCLGLGWREGPLVWLCLRSWSLLCCSLSSVCVVLLGFSGHSLLQGWGGQGRPLPGQPKGAPTLQFSPKQPCGHGWSEGAGGLAAQAGGSGAEGGRSWQEVWPGRLLQSGWGRRWIGGSREQLGGRGPSETGEETSPPE